MSSSKEIRSQFLSYFQDNGHEVVPSSPLVPGNDPTLLFTNAGMVQFKDVFLGADRRPYKRATTSQRCVRAGGKHNDLENVGYTARHHTFFEMLGNFSFGDYFKEEAIHFCWDLITNKFGLPKEKLWVTVYKDDDEAADIWIKQIGVPADRLTRCGEKDNFWSMGDTGPCGPCSELFYDHGPEIWGGPPGTPEEDGDRYIELWNLVFMQYDRAADGTMTPLPAPSVDTGMGLERIAAVLQDVHSNYETDLFQALIKASAEVTSAADLENKSLRVIADHIRSCAFLICDGVVPSNEGRGYVLRRIIRRALRHGHHLGTNDLFLYKLVGALEAEMGEAYPELGQRREAVERVIKQEEERFAETLDQGMKILDQAIEDLSGTEIPGETVFRLYDTYGFPVDLTADIARERDLSVDMDAFEANMEAQRERARSAGKWSTEAGSSLEVDAQTEFKGYEQLDVEGQVVGLYLDGEAVEQLGPEDNGMVVLDVSPFYAESGGQVGDGGRLSCGAAIFEVRDTQRQGDAIVHIGVQTEGELKMGATVAATVDNGLRSATARNHSATHLMHAAIQLATQDGFALAALIARRAVDDYYTKFSFWGVSCHNVVSVGANKILKSETSSKRGEWELKPCKNGNIDFYNSVFDFNYRNTFGRSRRDFDIWSYIINAKKGISENFFELYKNGNIVGYANINANNIYEISLVKGIETEGLLNCIFDHSVSEELRIEIPVGHHLFDRFCSEGDVIYRQCLFGGHMVRVLDRVFLNKTMKTGLDPHMELNANETMSAIGAQNLGHLVQDKGLGPPIPFNIPRADQI